MSSLSLVISILALSVFPSCSVVTNAESKNENEGGIVFTFDDNNLASWLLADEKFDFVATFYVTGFQSEQAESYRFLQSRGHEIGHHTASHYNIKEYIYEYGWEQYLDTEILDYKIKMENEGLRISNFAFPYGVSAMESLLLDVFISVRSTTYGEIDKGSDIYLDFAAPDKSFGALGIDVVYGRTDEEIYRIIEHAAGNNLFVVFYGHAIRPDYEASGYSTSYDRLEQIIGWSRKHDLPMRTVQDMFYD